MASSRLYFLLFWTASAAAKPVDLLMIRAARLVYLYSIHVGTRILYGTRVEKKHNDIIYRPER